MEFEDKVATQEKIGIIVRQTNYTEEEAQIKLRENNGNHVTVIKNYMGIEEKKERIVGSVNQEIYRQLRHKLDDSVREYNKKQQEKLASEIAKNNE
jgi:hypothetical protein